MARSVLSADKVDGDTMHYLFDKFNKTLFIRNQCFFRIVLVDIIARIAVAIAMVLGTAS